MPGAKCVHKGSDVRYGMVRPCSCPASDKLARGRPDKEHAMPATAQTAIAVIGIDIGKNSFSRRGSQ